MAVSDELTKALSDAMNERANLSEVFWRALEAYQEADKKVKALRVQFEAEKDRP